MLSPIKVIDIEVSQPMTDLENLEAYQSVLGLVRLQGTPVGYIKLPIHNGRCSAAQIQHHLLNEYSLVLSKVLLHQILIRKTAITHIQDHATLDDWLIHQPTPREWPTVTVAVCTRNRTSDLARCLEALVHLDYPSLDWVVVDNAPDDDSTHALVSEHYPAIRYICEPRPGLDWARNRAILAAEGDLLAFTDDDVVVDSGWVQALAQVFIDNPRVMAVTGLVVPYELETSAQQLFEHYGGFGRGFEQKWYQVLPHQVVPWPLLGTGQFGTGANMAFRTEVFNHIGYFDPALDVGTATNGAGDLELFFRVIKAGLPLVYEPRALVYHRHRQTYERLKRQINYNGSLMAYIVCGWLSYPDQRIEFVKLSYWWVFKWLLRRWLISKLHPTRLPIDLIEAEIQGSWHGLTLYFKAQQEQELIETQFGPFAAETLPSKYVHSPKQPQAMTMGVRQIDLAQPLSPLTELETYYTTRIFVRVEGHVLGQVDIDNYGQSISVDRLSQAIVKHLWDPILGQLWALSPEGVEAALRTLWYQYYPNPRSRLDPLPDDVSVSIVVATFDRPDDLRQCLNSLQKQQTERQVEIIVVDNHPASGLTPPVLADFSDVIGVSEPRQGSSYARNAGICVSTGQIIVVTDDDVIAPPDWLETLIQPFTRPDVMAVTGNVLPLELETPSQQAFEAYGGLGRGYQSLEVNGDWFELFPHKPSPTWTLGGTANVAFRTCIFDHPDIGLMDEALGPGMPSGVGEDTYLFYKVLKAGYTIIYCAQACVWHKHRQTLAALRRQLFNYSKGHVSYNLTTWLKDGDWRGLAQVLIGLPKAHGFRVKERLLGRSSYPLSLIGIEILGNLAGPWSLGMSHLLVKQRGTSSPYVPVEQRSNLAPKSCMDPMSVS